MRATGRWMLSDTIKLLDPAAEVLGHVAFEGVYCTWTESVGYDLALSAVFDTVAHIKNARYS